MLTLGSDKSRGLESFIHDITGDGLPVTIQSNVASFPLVTEAYPGFLAILGNPEGVLSAKEKKNISINEKPLKFEGCVCTRMSTRT